MIRNAIITGAAGGIGYATAVRFCREGYHVIAFDVLPEEAVKEKFAGMSVTYVQGNLASEEDRARLVEVARSKGSITALINVAGVAPKVRGDLLEMSEESYDFVMDINTKGTFFLTQAVANAMLAQPKEERGAIVNISSMSAYTSSTSRGEYCISKAGVSMITKLFADRLAGEGIVVNEIRPGIIATGMTQTVKEKYDNLIAGGLLPIPRWGLPEDIAEAVLALCSPAFRYTTGQSVDVDGGFHLRRL